MIDDIFEHLLFDFIHKLNSPNALLKQIFFKSKTQFQQAESLLKATTSLIKFLW